MGGERVRARKKNRQLISISDGVGGGGNGIVGLLMFGGALAVTAALVFNKNKTKDPATTHPKPKPQHQQQQLSLDNSEEEEDHKIETIQEGLRVLLQPSTTPTNEADASGRGEIHTKSINNTCVTEEKIEAVPDLSNVSEEVQEIVFSDDSNPESGALLQDRQGCSEAQDVEVEAQEIQQFVEVEIESQGDFVSEIEKEEDLNEKPDFGAAEEDTGEASSDEKDNDQPSAQGGDIVSKIDKEDGSLWNSTEKPDFCPAEGGNREDKIDTTTDADNGAVTFTGEANSDEKDSDQSSTASHSFQLPTRVMPLLLLPLFFILLFIIDHTQQFFSVL